MKCVFDLSCNYFQLKKISNRLIWCLQIWILPDITMFFSTGRPATFTPTPMASSQSWASFP